MSNVLNAARIPNTAVAPIRSIASRCASSSAGGMLRPSALERINMSMMHHLRLVLVAVFVTAASCQRAPAARGLQQDRLAWQTGVICSTPPACKARDTRLLTQFASELKGSSSYPTQTSRLGNITFMVLAQYLQPNQSNVQFAQAFCASRGGTLAFWTTPQQYSALAALAQKLAATPGKRVWHLYTGLVQLPGSVEPTGGWVWSQTNATASSIAWGKGEPNQHNSGIPGHTEDCGVVATYHGPRATRLVDDFPCNYAAGGKWFFNNYNPKLSLACRMG